MRKMKTFEKPLRPKTALEKIGEFLTKEQGGSNAEFIRRMRAAYFADVDALQKSGRVVLPK